MEKVMERNPVFKNLKSGKRMIFGSFAIIAAISFSLTSCKKDVDAELMKAGNAVPPVNVEKEFTVVNLVADVSAYNPAHVDPNLVNAWGMAFNDGAVWISSAEKGLSTIYDNKGSTLREPVSIPFGSDPNGGNPTGLVYNDAPGSAFIIPSTNEVSKFIFATENGTIDAWASGSSAVVVSDQSSSGAVYKGLALLSVGSISNLYATDFHNGKIDVFDAKFQHILVRGFKDPIIPAGFAPFGIRAFGNNLLVTYAKQKGPDNDDDEPGLGNGYVDLYTRSGILIKRFASGGTLNSPWGIAISLPAATTMETASVNLDYGRTIFIGNFGDGYVNVFRGDGTFLGQLKGVDHKPLHIDGLWAISYAPFSFEPGVNPMAKLYFTAGPEDETHGLFGYIKM